MKTKGLLFVGWCMAIILQLMLATVPSIAQATGEGKSGGVGVDAPNCINTTNGITGGGCSGNLTLQLAPNGSIAATFGLGLRVDNSSSSFGNAALYGRQGSTTGIAWYPAGVWGDSYNSIGVLGTSTSGWGVYGRTNNSTNAAVYGLNSSNGAGVRGESSGGYGVEAYSNSGGTGLIARGGNAVYGESIVSQGTGVWGVSSTGTNARGVYGTSPSGTGVVGRVTGLIGTGVEAMGNGGSTTALKITNGGIKVTNPYESSAPVFTFEADGAYLCGTNDGAAFINNPFANNNPDAKLFITPVTLSPASASFSVYYNTGGIPNYSDCPTNQWLIIGKVPGGSSTSPFVYTYVFNVMVITP